MAISDWGGYAVEWNVGGVGARGGAGGCADCAAQFATQSSGIGV